MTQKQGYPAKSYSSGKELFSADQTLLPDIESER